MKPGDNPNWFAHSPLTRVNSEKDRSAFIEARLKDPDSILVPLWRGDPLVAGGKAAFLSAAALAECPKDAPVVLLGLKDDRAYFGVDLSSAAQDRAQAPFAEMGDYLPIRAAAGVISQDDLAIIGHGRWLFEWRRKHLHCPICGARTELKNGGAKSACPACESEHFPRCDPVAIVLPVHDDHCLLARGPHFPPGFLSALAGYVEPAETPEEAARREIFEEAGVVLSSVRYQFSQPWPFPTSLMMGFIADAEARTLDLDTDELEEARWISRRDIDALRAGEARDGIFLPPPFTIARQLIERWTGGA